MLDALKESVAFTASILDKLLILGKLIITYYEWQLLTN